VKKNKPGKSKPFLQGGIASVLMHVVQGQGGRIPTPPPPPPPPATPPPPPPPPPTETSTKSTTATTMPSTEAPPITTTVTTIPSTETSTMPSTTSRFFTMLSTAAQTISNFVPSPTQLLNTSTAAITAASTEILNITTTTLTPAITQIISTNSTIPSTTFEEYTPKQEEYDNTSNGLMGLYITLGLGAIALTTAGIVWVIKRMKKGSNNITQVTPAEETTGYYQNPSFIPDFNPDSYRTMSQSLKSNATARSGENGYVIPINGSGYSSTVGGQRYEPQRLGVTNVYEIPVDETGYCLLVDAAQYVEPHTNSRVSLRDANDNPVYSIPIQDHDDSTSTDHPYAASFS